MLVRLAAAERLRIVCHGIPATRLHEHQAHRRQFRTRPAAIERPVKVTTGPRVLYALERGDRGILADCFVSGDWHGRCNLFFSAAEFLEWGHAAEVSRTRAVHCLP